MATREGRIRYRFAKRARAGHKSRQDLPAPVAAALPSEQGTVTLLQVSTSYCAPCRHAKTVLSELAERTDGLRYVNLDVTDQPEVARAIGVLRTPTTVAFTAAGQELLRVSGVPKTDELLTALRTHLVSQNEHGSHPESA
ncbi:thiol-disulfide isomerase/thioredoxin [Saccharomonospora amisosensis]|uniref:Thiol-disulfide isomerase/thioredoxin n=1 Tax=Saccharomonospora amisosensis TaxID=1128677 RepID=A0A7X5UVZ5_9PSEU|nr:thiol-disulfide isomerase/thioredoxin [Saccharomonospora amisosensis]